ncbi:MAG: hypothetical protein M3387_00935 [Actinomycetota bacterium]|nr:hypothetical protein [Actinomycetota bacterium]
MPAARQIRARRCGARDMDVIAVVLHDDFSPEPIAGEIWARLSVREVW